MGGIFTVTFETVKYPGRPTLQQGGDGFRSAGAPDSVAQEGGAVAGEAHRPGIGLSFRAGCRG